VTADGSNAISQGDGAPWVWNLVQLHWPAAVEVLDYYHLSEHLHACAQAVWGVGSARARAWARDVGGQVLLGDAAVLRQALGRLRPATETGQQAVAALQRYVQTHAHRIGYGALRQQGYASRVPPSRAPITAWSSGASNAPGSGGARRGPVKFSRPAGSGVIATPPSM